MPTADPLIRTKLHLPFTRPGLVPRPRLQARIMEGLFGPLTLITAPAGFGKTTLLASCIAGCGMPIAWLSLDKNDNQIGRFLSYLVAALQEADNKIGSEAAQLMVASPQAPTEVVLTSLINDLDIAHKEIILVLDDFQYISNQAVDEEVAFLLEHCPSTLHMVIATRLDPPLPLVRLRARGQTVELRAAELRFTEPEAAQFLNDVMGLHLNAGSIAMLEERTEGWIAGLQMAALSMRDREDVNEFIAGFSGTNRYILDYLIEEVLATQPPEIQHFLLVTSILERLTAPLCEAITEIRESRMEISDESRLSNLDSQSILEHLERANLFLVPLDDERIWYRYHHLFADLLRARLDQIYPGLAPRLHARAAAWLEREGMTVETVNHTLAAGEYDRAARLVEENTARLLAEGELNALMGWIETLPAELRLSRPGLCVHQAYVLALGGRLAEVPPLLAQAEATLGAATVQGAVQTTGEAAETYIPSARDAESLSPGEGRSLAGAITAIRAMAAAMSGLNAEAISLARHARQLLPAENLWDRAAAAWALGYALHMQGHLAEARSAFEDQEKLGRVMSNIATLMIGPDLAWVLRDQGKIRQARAHLEEALAKASQKGVHTLGFIARTRSTLASMLYEQNELGAARHLLSDALTFARFFPNPNHLPFTYALLARVLLAEGDLHGARRYIGEADRLRRSTALTRLVRRMVEVDLVRVWLAFQASGIPLETGDPLADQAGSLMASWRNELAGWTESMDDAAETAVLTQARVALTAGHAEEALSLLEPVTRSAQAAGHINTAVNSLALTAIARQAAPAPQGRPDGRARGSSQPVSTLADLEEVLDLAEPGGYVRVFLDEGRPMQTLLAQWLAHAGNGPLRDYAVQLLSHFDAEPQEVTAVQKKASPTGDLVEPLSERELEVLHLIATGRTNKEIAQQLIVALGTVKAHTASIFRKLDVANRTEAVAQARQLGILP